ncbi:phospholipase D-like domain-containing protein [Chryseolinea sp. T2]|uniref:phospholipase D-like domain-containing protein n=1 Tax=Chryseolinea sp. T2 TaxID=3129255 RepID=UPI00307899BF
MVRKSSSAGAGYSLRNDVKLIHDGGTYFRVLEEMIDAARETVHFQMYIFEADITGTRIAEALKRAAARKVSVYMMLDGYASRPLPASFVNDLRSSGVHFRWFQPLFRGDNFFVGRRMHHKIIVVDALHSLVGGRNISNRYNDLPGQPGWLDWAVHATGDISRELYNRCVLMYFRRPPKSQAVGPALASLEECRVRMRVNDWIRNKNQISRSYLEMLKRSEQSVTIMSSYFLPGRVFRKNLRLASKRGLRIRVIVTKLSDIPLAKHAERFFYPWLLRRNIEIYEYRRKVLHGKIGCRDGIFVTVGSFNFNDLSAYASIELNLDIHDKEFGIQVESSLEKIINEDCDRITAEDLRHKTRWWNTAMYRIAYALFRTFLIVFTISSDRERKTTRRL